MLFSARVGGTVAGKFDGTSGPPSFARNSAVDEGGSGIGAYIIGLYNPIAHERNKCKVYFRN
jgi:hypothetical protein